MDPRLLLIFLFGFLGGVGAFFIGAPLPFMLGGIFGAASFVLYFERDGRQLPRVSRWVRLVAMSVIGSMIGARFSPELLPLLPQFWISGLAILPFILVAHGGSYLFMRRLGGYRRLDAYFASLPGGIVDSAVLAEQAGADLRIVTVQHFIRIILVVVSVPLLFLFVQGDVVGSLAGETIATANYDNVDVLLILTIAMAGLAVGRWTGLPVSHMMVPLLFSLVLSVSGTVDINIPAWLAHLAQFLIGSSLGAQFSGLSRGMLVKGLGLGLVVGVYMMIVAATFAGVMMSFVPAGYGALFISFAAGGLAEMSLIAMSLNFTPVVVALHHIVRIVLTIWVGSFLARRIFKLAEK
ncbi:MAG: AbrB family transcriptional regulator [Pseudomonadota bacterium]|nr:AbrB family transcriptional regulator [Pseudomonadota bacterium]